MSEPTPHLSADDSLPEVEPPSAKFLVQLFLVPGLIVAAIVGLWTVINLVAGSGEDPREYFHDIQRSGPSRWQAAINLADALRGGGHEGLKRDREAVGSLAQILEHELAEGDASAESVELRKYLCKALGEMYVDDGLEVLLQAATTDRSPADSVVRQWAIEAIAVLAEHVAKENEGRRLESSQLFETMRALSRDDDQQVRTAATFAMGAIGGEAMLGELPRMLADPAASVRHNAAIRLVSEGDREALPVIEEILDPASQAELQSLQLKQRPSEYPEQQWVYRLEEIRNLTLQNALRAIEQFARKQPGEDLAQIAQLLRELAEEKQVHFALQHRATRLADAIDAR